MCPLEGAAARIHQPWSRSSSSVSMPSSSASSPKSAGLAASFRVGKYRSELSRGRTMGSSLRSGMRLDATLVRLPAQQRALCGEFRVPPALGRLLPDVARPAAADLDLPGTGSLRDGQGEREDAVLVARLDAVDIDRRAEPELAAEATLGPFAHDELISLLLLEPPL